MTKKPVIGILAEVDGELLTKVKNTYIKAIEAAGGIPLVFPYVENGDTLELMISACDGIFFTGGADISPKRYGEEIKPACGEIQKNRDALEFEAFGKAFALKKPILAICRGAQLVNVALGGTLYQDIPSELATDISHRQSASELEFSHSVNINKNTPLAALLGAERIQANSFHHQALKRLGEGLCVMATADDGVVEAVYYSGAQYIRAYQWHPERLCQKDAYNRKIFDDFIEACLK